MKTTVGVRILSDDEVGTAYFNQVREVRQYERTLPITLQGRRGGEDCLLSPDPCDSGAERATQAKFAVMTLVDAGSNPAGVRFGGSSPFFLPALQRAGALSCSGDRRRFHQNRRGVRLTEGRIWNRA